MGYGIVGTRFHDGRQATDDSIADHWYFHMLPTMLPTIMLPTFIYWPKLEIPREAGDRWFNCRPTINGMCCPLACGAPVSHVAQLSMMIVWHVLPTSSTCCHPSILIPGIKIWDGPQTEWRRHKVRSKSKSDPRAKGWRRAKESQPWSKGPLTSS